MDTRRRAAFSLFELVIVLAIAAIVSSIGIVKYSGSLTHYRLDGAVKRILADVHNAQVQARTTSSVRAVRFDPATSSYAVLSRADLDQGRSGNAVRLAEDPYRAVIVVNGIANNLVRFNGYGDPDGGGIITVTCGGRSAAVILEATTGRVYVAGEE